MCPIDAQRLRFVCSATSFAPSTTFEKSRFDSPWPCVTMQKRCAPAASAACACSRICSGDIIACIGVWASAKRDWAQNPQSSAQPPDLAFTSEHRSVESPKRSGRGRQRALHQGLDLRMILDLAERERFLVGDERGQDSTSVMGLVMSRYARLRTEKGSTKPKLAGPGALEVCRLPGSARIGGR